MDENANDGPGSADLESAIAEAVGLPVLTQPRSLGAVLVPLE